MITLFLRLLSWPLRRLARLFGGSSLRTVEKSGTGVVAQKAGDGAAHFEDERADEPRQRSLFFKRLPRPTLVERTASDLTVEEAREYAAEAEKFYTYPFPLFTRADLFYEEVEQDYVDHVLGRTEGSADANFLGIMDRFRRELNANTARLFLVYAPALLLLTIGAALVLPSFVGPLFAGRLSVAGFSANRYAIEALTLGGASSRIARLNVFSIL